VTEVDVGRIGRGLRGLAPAGVLTGARRIVAADVDVLHDSERRVVANAVAKRRHEFASGRVLLRDLLGMSDEIPVGPTRAPVLPAGAVGSLAHDRAVVVAAISRDPRIAAVGIDVEPDETLPADMARIILRDDEAGIDAHLAFTLKEAAYKAWSNSGGRMLDHHDVRLTVAGDRFTATVLPDGRRLDGRFVTVAGRHLALVVLAA
jgi:4'-phosphopantetheinyl transferase EntD